MSLKVSLLHPTRGRPKMAFDIFNEWVGKAVNPTEIEYIMTLDDDDLSIPAYQEELAKIDQSKVGRFVFHIGTTRTCVDALHQASLLMSPETELIMGMTDDVWSMQDWDKLLFDILKPFNNFTEPKYIGVQDGIHAFGAWLYLIINKAWYTKVGYVICTDYTGCYADNDMREISIKLNCVIEAPQILFEHRHPCTGKGVWDATYARHNNQNNMDENRKIFEARSARGFDLNK